MSFCKFDINSHLGGLMRLSRIPRVRLRAKAVGELGLALQAIRAVATQASISEIVVDLWEGVAPWTKLASKKFVELVDAEIEKIKMEGVGNMSESE